MNLLRRKVLSLSIGAAAWPLASPVVRANAFPPRAVHIVVGIPPGGIIDASARLIAPAPGGGTPAEMAAFIKDETRRWSEVIKNAGIKPE